jgi:hypothetical protein
VKCEQSVQWNRRKIRTEIAWQYFRASTISSDRAAMQLMPAAIVIRWARIAREARPGQQEDGRKK